MKLQTPVLITGASGFVGANLLRRLIKETPPKKVYVLLRKNSDTWRIDDLLKKVSVYVVDMRDQRSTEKLILKIKPKTIFHLATHGAYPYQQNDEREIMETNIICTFNLLQASLQVGFNAFVNTGSSSEYGINIKLMSEDDMSEPVTSYGVSKAWATLYGKYLNLVQGAPITTLRLFGVYGFYEPRGRLVPNLILALLNNKQPTLIASNFARDFVFIDDVVNAYFSATVNDSPESVFNIGSGNETKLKEMFSLIRGLMKIEIEPILDNHTNRSVDINRRIADIKLAKKYLKWEPKTKLHDGLEQTVEWFKKNIALYK